MNGRLRAYTLLFRAAERSLCAEVFFLRRSQSLLLNTLLLTASSILMRLVGLAFQVYLSNSIGAAGIGLLYLILSVSGFAATFAISGARFAAMRLVSEEIGAGNLPGARATVRRCLAYAAGFGTAAAALLYGFSGFIGCTLIGDGRTVLSLKILGLSLPFLSMGAVLSGYFTAVCRVIKSAAGQMFEQAVRIAVIVGLFSIAPLDNVEIACAAVMVGNVAGELLSFFFELLLYTADRKKHMPGRPAGHGLTRRLLHIALPLALSAYARTALTSAENLLVPRGLRGAGATGEQALADYGRIQGMVFPIITFPAAFFVSLAELMIPQLTHAQVAGRTREISATVSRILRLCFVFSLFVAGVLILCAQALGQAIYRDAAVGGYIRAFALLMPVMYLDTVTDGMLKGLGEQMYSMRVNIIDSLLSVALVWLVLPKAAVPGYIVILYLSELFNFSLSLRRLTRITRVEFRPGRAVLTLLCAAGAAGGVHVLHRTLWPGLSGAAEAVTHTVLTGGLYFLLLLLTGVLSAADTAWLRVFVRRKNGEI